jgi:hypothetical protein
MGVESVQQRGYDDGAKKQSYNSPSHTWDFPFLMELGNIGKNWQVGGGVDTQRRKNQNGREKP